MIITQRKRLQGILEYHIFVRSGTQYLKKYREKKGDFTCRYPQAIENNTEKEREVMGTLLYTGKKAAGRTIV